MNKEPTDRFYQEKSEPTRGCLLSLRDIILNFNPYISETRKYGMPCFCYNKKALCYLWTDQKTGEPYLLMVKGNLLHHPSLETGKRKRMKIFKVKPEEDIPLNSINSIFEEAVQLY